METTGPGQTHVEAVGPRQAPVAATALFILAVRSAVTAPHDVRASAAEACQPAQPPLYIAH